MNYCHYVEQVLKEHLLTPNYQYLSKTTASNRIEDTKQKLRDIYNTNKNKISQAEVNFFKRSLLHLIPSYIEDSKSLIFETTGAKLFTADATAMYTNIDVETGMTIFRILFDTHRESIPPSFPTEFFLSILEIVMNSNIFMFGDTH